MILMTSQSKEVVKFYVHLCREEAKGKIKEMVLSTSVWFLTTNCLKHGLSGKFIQHYYIIDLNWKSYRNIK